VEASVEESPAPPRMPSTEWRPDKRTVDQPEPDRRMATSSSCFKVTGIAGRFEASIQAAMLIPRHQLGLTRAAHDSCKLITI